MKLLIPFFILFSPNAYSVVDTSQGAFIQSWTDFVKPGLDLDVPMLRTYSSRSNHVGIFGAGWCSGIETKIETDANEITLNYCGDGKRVKYSTKNSSAAEALFVTSGKADGVFKKDGKDFARILPGGIKEIYSKGMLKQISRADTNESISFRYDKEDFLKEIVDGSGRKLIFVKNGQFVTEIYFYSNPDGKKATKKLLSKYTYKDDLLTEMTNSWNHTYSYQYDSQKNMTKAMWPGGKSIQLTYFANNDWVASLKGSDICDEQYDYKVASAKPLPLYKVSVKKSCPKATFTERTQTYTFSADAQRLTAAVMDDNGNTVDYSYDDKGNIVKVIRHSSRGDLVTIIERNDLGLISKTSNSAQVVNYKYIKGKTQYVMSEVQVIALALGHEIANDIYSFGYNENDQLIASKNGSKKLSFSYDDAGKIDSIQNGTTIVKVVYGTGTNEISGVESQGKTLPLDIYSKKRPQEEIAIVEQYFDYVRMLELTVPRY